MTPDLSHRVFDEGPFWHRIPAYAGMDATTFLDPDWQLRHSLRSVHGLLHLLGPLASPQWIEDLRRGVEDSNMSLRLTPYLVALINWDDFQSDPIRRQFLPLASEHWPDPPHVAFDPLAEKDSSPLPGLVHRYPDRVLYLALDTCPVYCRYCTRSYAVGPGHKDPEAAASSEAHRWKATLEWLTAHPEIEDVVLSGGDLLLMSPAALRSHAQGLLSVPTIRRFRIATKALAVLPSRLRAGDPWAVALRDVVQEARDHGVEASLHTHINHPREITWVTRDAAEWLFQEGIPVRNQSVLLRGVNDDLPTMALLVRRLAHLHIRPYYVYLCDPAPGMESLRTSLGVALELEKGLRGLLAGFQVPTFVVDLQGGGGKQEIRSFETYDRSTGVSIFRSPNIDPDREYRYHDPAPAGPAA